MAVISSDDHGGKAGARKSRDFGSGRSVWGGEDGLCLTAVQSKICFQEAPEAVEVIPYVVSECCCEKISCGNPTTPRSTMYNPSTQAHPNPNLHFVPSASNIHN